MRLIVLPFVLLAACSKNEPPTNPPVTPPDETEDTATAKPPADAPAPAPWDETQAFVDLYDVLRVADAAGFAKFTGAAIVFEREHSISEDPPTTVTIAAEDAQKWLSEVAATWAESCLETFEPPCLTYNPLSLGTPDGESPQLECTDGCCRHQPALLHNTPFLREVCFDDQHRVTKVSILDG
ncbi:MAG: hypothetical protein AAF799_33570 [Myxococcota bacterium]